MLLAPALAAATLEDFQLPPKVGIGVAVFRPRQ